MRNVLFEILEWSQQRPSWQQDALRRILTSEDLTGGLDDLVDICKATNGLTEARPIEPLSSKHIAVQSSQDLPVTLESVTHRRGVNALAANQTVTFGPNLTVVYGPNSAGKSGFTRILKRACRSRGVENVLGNVLSGEVPLNPHAVVRFRNGDNSISFDWFPGTKPSDILSKVSVFDSQCAPIYLKDKTDVAFRPFGLDVFDRLSNLCGQVRTKLESELSSLNAKIPSFPVLPEGTRPRALLDNLSSLTKIESVRALAELSADEEARLKALREQLLDSRSSNPKQRARELELRSARVRQVEEHVLEIEQVLGDGIVAAAITSASDEVRVTKEALRVLQQTALTSALIAHTGEAVWKQMWDAATAFSAVAGREFPETGPDGRCPLCQQLIGSDAAVRLTHFAHFVSSEAQANVKAAEKTYQEAWSPISRLVAKRADLELALTEIASDDPRLALRTRNFLDEAAKVQEEVKVAAAQYLSPRSHPLPSNPAAALRMGAQSLEDRARQLSQQNSMFDPQLMSELNELESRATLGTCLQAVINEVERKKRILAYRLAIDDTITNAITRKSTELTKELVTDQLRETFRQELIGLEFDHLAVEVQVAGGAKGALFHRLAFTNAPDVNVTDVLSEGESRTLSLAAFLTELTTASERSAIIFDDPVSSLDHVWRERIARRLVRESKQRQVVVFTHDILFLRVLLDESQRQGVPCHHQYVRRESEPGICSPDLPWLAMGTKERVGKLRVRWQGAEKLYRTCSRDVYEIQAREIYGLLREAWEHAISEILLNDVIEPYRPSIETRKVSCLHDITEVDCRKVEEGMTDCSRWIRGHDHPAADGTPFPTPAELLKQIDAFDEWAKEIKRRRQ